MSIKRFIFIVLLLFPLISLGATGNNTSNVTLDLTLNYSDKSTQLLGNLFGTVGSILPGSGNNLLAKLFGVFNTIILALGSIVLMYTTGMSTINTAHEGEVMGKKWSSMWIPIRSAASIGLLLPTGNGYSLIQVMIMTIVLQGVNAANQVWNKTLDFVSRGQGINDIGLKLQKLTAANRKNDLGHLNNDRSEAETFIKAAFPLVLCVQALNNTPPPSLLSNSGAVSCYQDPTDQKTIACGIAGDPVYSKVCGSIRANYTGDESAFVQTNDEINNIEINAALNTLTFLQSFANEAILKTEDGYIFNKDSTDKAVYWTSTNALSLATTSYLSLVSEIQRPPKDKGANGIEQIKNDGWIYAGAYYYRLTNLSKDQLQTSFTGAPVVTAPDTNSSLLGEKETPSSPTISTIITDANKQYAQYCKDNGQRTNDEINPSTPSLARIILESYINALTSGTDPLLSLQTVGITTMVTIEGMFWALLIGFTAIIATTSVCSAVSPAPWTTFAVMLMIFPLILTAASVLWSGGAALGIYLPLVPYTVFTLSAIAWFISVIEAMVAAPIIALGLAAPSNEHLGRASPAIILLCNVFLRPTLMIIGFIAGSRLLVVAMDMLSTGFTTALAVQIYGPFTIVDPGLFGALVLIVIFIGFCTTIVNKSFSLIYVIPDKVLRWIGGQNEGSGVSQEVDKVKHSAEQGAKMAQEGLTAVGTKVAAFAKSRVDDKIKEAKEAKEAKAAAAKKDEADADAGGYGPLARAAGGISIPEAARLAREAKAGGGGAAPAAAGGGGAAAGGVVPVVAPAGGGAAAAPAGGGGAAAGGVVPVVAPAGGGGGAAPAGGGGGGGGGGAAHGGAGGGAAHGGAGGAVAGGGAPAPAAGGGAPAAAVAGGPPAAPAAPAAVVPGGDGDGGGGGGGGGGGAAAVAGDGGGGGGGVAAPGGGRRAPAAKKDNRDDRDNRDDMSARAHKK